MVSGIICEFNPFHNGHAYLINNAKVAGEKVICVMSGNFVQRGELAIYEKHKRAEMALKNGADLVISLPVGWSMSGAENFAFGSVSLLKETGVVDKLVFGCETYNKDLLIKTADILYQDKFSFLMKKYISCGVTFAAARQKAVTEYYPECADIVSKPNNILATQYILAAKQLDFDVEFLPVARVGVEHDSNIIEQGYSSASNLRDMIKSGNITQAEQFIPENIAEMISSLPYSDLNKLDSALLFKLRSLSADDIRKIPDVSEGIENRIFEQIKTASSFIELLSGIKTKRYTLARIRRILMCAAFGIDNSYLKKEPPYIHILGYTNNGKELISDIAEKSSVPLIISNKDLEKLDDFGKKVFETEALTTDMFGLAFTPPLPCGNEYTLPVIKV